MSFRMYVYDMGIVDFYEGMMPLLDYIKLCSPKGGAFDDDYQYLNHRNLKGFLINCFMEVMVSGAGWDGDIRGLSEIAISAIPRPSAAAPYKMLVFKQDNNGQSFLVSELKLHHYHLNERDSVDEDVKWVPFEKNSIDGRDLMASFYESFDLVERLFDKALNNNEEKISEKFIAITLPSENIKKEDPKFNLDNYEKI